MVNLHQKSLFDVLTQHQAYLYRHLQDRSMNFLIYLIPKQLICLPN